MQIRKQRIRRNLAAIALFVVCAFQVEFAKAACMPSTGTRFVPTTNSLSNDNLGGSVAADRDMAFLGSPGRWNPDPALPAWSRTGAVFVARKTGSNWAIDSHPIFPPGGASGDQFGQAVAIEGDWAAVGAPNDDSGRGTVHIYRLINTNWVHQQSIVLSTRVAGDYFGGSVAISGQVLVIGASGRQGYAGAAFIYRRVNSTWNLAQSLALPTGVNYDYFGCSVDVSSDSIIVGAYGSDILSQQYGAAYLYQTTDSGNTWTLAQRLDPQGGAAGLNQFGTLYGISVAVDGDLAVVGAGGTDNFQGSAFIFRRTGSGWTPEARLTSSDAVTGYSFKFGNSVGISASRISVGAPHWTNIEGGQNQQGKTYFFQAVTWSDGSVEWREDFSLVALSPWAGGYAHLGAAVALDGSSIVVGAPDEAGAAPNKGGSAYFFDVACTTGCTSSAECTDDGNVCTTESCVSGICHRADNTLACADDGNSCTNDICSAGVCTHPAKPNNTACSPDTNACTNDVCNAGVCTHPNKPAGSACGNAAAGLCDDPDTCNGSGVCLSNNLPNTTPCADDGNQCTRDYCMSGTCVHPNNPTGWACDDGSASTVDDRCENGVCTGTPTTAGCVNNTDCNDSNPCTTDACVNSTCVYTNNSLPCDDGLFCNGADTCSAGSCSVHAGNPCASGQVCANVCNEAADNCFAAANVACTPDTNPCTYDVCNGSGSCIHPFKPAGSACGNSATGLCDNPDTCNASGVCVANNLPNGTACADDGNECTFDVCSNGQCVHPAKPNNTPCTPDGNACTNDVCSAGVCTHPLKPAGSACGSSSSSLCDNPDTCSATGVCLANNLPNGTACADDGNECTNDVCNSGVCTHPPKANNTPCDDGNICTVSDYCLSGVCRGGGALSCDDGDACTNDSCGPKGCLFVDRSCPTGQTCVDGDCIAQGGCNDGICWGNEDECNCPEDCATVELLCGNGICDAYAGEDCRNCPGDCRGRLSGPPNKRFCCGDDGTSCASTDCNYRGWTCTNSGCDDQRR